MSESRRILRRDQVSADAAQTSGSAGKLAASAASRISTAVDRWPLDSAAVDADRRRRRMPRLGPGGHRRQNPRRSSEYSAAGFIDRSSFFSKGFDSVARDAVNATDADVFQRALVNPSLDGFAADPQQRGSLFDCQVLFRVARLLAIPPTH